MAWRRSYDTPPPAIEPGSEWDVSTSTRGYARLLPRRGAAHRVPRRRRGAPAALLVRRDRAADLLRSDTVLVVAHGNSLRALIKHLDGLSGGDVVNLNVPTGIPLVYDLDAALRPTGPAR